MFYRCFQRENIPELIMSEYIQSSNMCPLSDNKSIEGDQQSEWNVGKKIRQDIFMQGCQYEYRISSNKRQASNKRLIRPQISTFRYLQSWSEYFGTLQCLSREPINHK